MTRKKVFLMVQSLICALAACLLAAGALCLYFGGSRQEEGSLITYIYSRELAGEKLLTALPVLLTGIVTTMTGMLLGIRDEKALEPVWDEKRRRKRETWYPDGLRAERKTTILRGAILIIAVALIIAGILNGGAQDVLAKGATICAECIGLG